MTIGVGDTPLLPKRYAWSAAVLLLLLCAAGIVRSLYTPGFSITEVFFRDQDLGPALAIAAGLILLPRVRLRATWASAPRLDRIRLAALAALAALTAWIGAKLVFGDYTLAGDETMARFDATILAHGRLMAAVPPAARPLEAAMAPNFLAPVAGGAAWSSNYLPVSAGFQALFGRLGDADLASAALLALALLATWGVGRRLWPDRPERAAAAALLLACAPQVLVTAMTPYAMTTHLALDMAWLWLWLGRSRRSQVAAAGVAWLATGLHQLLFHPLFAAPFVLSLWLERRWARAAFHTAAYAAIGAFWASYPTLAAHLSGVTLEAHAAGGPFATLAKLLTRFDPWGGFLMAENTVRLLTWSHVLLLPLWLAGAWAALRMRGVERALALGPVLTFAAVWLLLPYQGHGWGYRYLHGELGPVALTAALGATAIADRLGPRAPVLWAAFWGGLAATVLLLSPLRAWQAHRFAAPYARAYAAMTAPARRGAVLLDADGLFYGWDVVRDDPFLRNTPKLYVLQLLDRDDLAAICAAGPVTLFDARDLRALGVPAAASLAADHRSALAGRETLGELRCGVRPDGSPAFTPATAAP